MNITLDCIPCFVRHTVEVVRQFTQDVDTQKKIVKEILSLIATLDFAASPPEFAGVVHEVIRNTLNCDDPYLEIKNNSNRAAAEIVSQLQKNLQNKVSAQEKLRQAILYAIAGNIIDSGVSAITSEEEIQKSIWMAENVVPVINQLPLLLKSIEKADRILILGDNAGEIFFDKMMLENFPAGKCLYYAVKSGAILNDATIKDALEAKIDELAQVITNGTRIPGTPLNQVSPDFLKVFQSADLIIAKGQANFETLSHLSDPRLFFLLRAKCSVIARLVDVPRGSFIIATNSDLN